MGFIKGAGFLGEQLIKMGNWTESRSRSPVRSEKKKTGKNLKAWGRP